MDFYFFCHRNYSLFLYLYFHLRKYYKVFAKISNIINVFHIIHFFIYMSSRKKTKEKKRIKKVLKKFKFKSLHLSLSKQITLLGCIIWYVSLFFPWIIDVQAGITWNAFNSLTWNIWYLLTLILFIPIFLTFSTNHKDKIKLYTNISVKNHFLVLTVWFFVLSFSIITLSFVNGLHTFFENTIYWNGVILSMTAGIIILIGWFMIRNEYYKESSEIILNAFNQNKEKVQEKDNMKLPF